MSMVFGLYQLPSCRIVDVFVRRVDALERVRESDPTAHFGHPMITGLATENAIYCMNTDTGESEALFYVGYGEDWYFELLKQTQRHDVND